MTRPLFDDCDPDELESDAPSPEERAIDAERRFAGRLLDTLEPPLTPFERAYLERCERRSPR